MEDWESLQPWTFHFVTDKYRGLQFFCDNNKSNVELFDLTLTIDSVSFIGETMFYMAVKCRHWYLADHIIKKGYNINKRDNWNQSVLHYFILEYNIPSIEYLLSRGCTITLNDMKMQGKYGRVRTILRDNWNEQYPKYCTQLSEVLNMKCLGPEVTDYINDEVPLYTDDL